MSITHTGENFTFSPVLLVGSTISQIEILLIQRSFHFVIIQCRFLIKIPRFLSGVFLVI